MSLGYVDLEVDGDGNVLFICESAGLPERIRPRLARLDNLVTLLGWEAVSDLFYTFICKGGATKDVCLDEQAALVARCILMNGLSANTIICRILFPDASAACVMAANPPALHAR